MQQSESSQPSVIVVGGGLAGLAAAHTVLRSDGHVILVEKEKKLGGNSMKASSGINGAESFVQQKLEITDDVALFATDTMRSATGEASADVNDLVSVLTRHSAGAIDWLVNAMGVDLALVSQLGGHSRPRTHRPVKAPAGFAIMSALMKLLEDYPPERLQIKTGTKMRSLIEADGSVKGIEVHPTGFVHAEDPDNKTKFLCGEALRGEGGLLLNSQGRRFVNELDLRDAVTAKMNEQSGRKYIVLNAKAAVDLGAHLGFYTFKKLMKKYDSSRALAEDLGMDPEALAAELKAYNRSAEQKCDAFNKTVFPAVPFETDEEYYAGEVTPVLHYTMGGIRMNPKAQIMRQGPGGDLQVIHRLYGAGEVTGGVHGNNRLGGNSLLECVVFGRIAGATAVADLAAEDKRA